MKVRTRPCVECPWRRDVPPGQFPASRYAELACTTGQPGAEAPLEAPMFACHMTAEGREKPCAGWLAVAGRQHLGVRLAVAVGAIPGRLLDPGDDWPALFGSYEEMATRQGTPQ